MTCGRRSGAEMILAIELQFDEWQHADCNGGIIRCIREATDEKIVVVATKKHIEAIENAENISLEGKCLIEIPGMSEADDSFFYQQYMGIISGVFRYFSVKNDDKIIFLSSPRNVMKVAYEIIPACIKTIFIQHANLNQLMKDERHYGEYAYKNLIERNATKDNVSFVTFSPNYSIVAEYIEAKFVRKFVFLHIPVNKPKNDIYSETSKYIGVYGQCVNSNFRRILKRMLSNGIGNMDRFLVLLKSGIGCNLDSMDYSYKFPYGLHIIQKPDGISYEEHKVFMKEMKWILLPYDKDMHVISASGIFADAVKYNIPIIALESPYIKHYKKFNIGIVENNIDILINKMELDQDKGNYEIYKQNLLNLREKMTNENIETLCRLLKG